jgi:hypothetical protein
MSHGPGAVERRIADLFAATRDRALDIDTITKHTFGVDKPTRAQRLSATRAAHRLIRRVREMDKRGDVLIAQARARVTAKLGPRPELSEREYNRMWRRGRYQEYERAMAPAWKWDALLESDPAYKTGTALREKVLKGGLEFWHAITIRKRLWFHPHDVPVQVWAVTIDRGGVHWFDAKIRKITERNVVVRYGGATARLNREALWHHWTWWRGVMFVSARSGRVAAELEAIWHRRHGTAGAPPPATQMPLEDARLMLGLPADYTREQVLAAFRRKVKAAHPDAGGTAEMFRLLVRARDRLLAAIGTSAPPPPPPKYAPTGYRVVYRSGRGDHRHRLGASTRRLPRPA